MSNALRSEKDTARSRVNMVVTSYARNAAAFASPRQEKIIHFLTSPERLLDLQA